MNVSKNQHLLLENKHDDEGDTHCLHNNAGDTQCLHNNAGDTQCLHNNAGEKLAQDPDFERNKLPNGSHNRSSQTTNTSDTSSHSSIDGGYAWVIVVASFFNAFIVDGIGSSFGLLFPHILTKFNSSAFLTSFAGSMWMAFLIMGSVSAMLVKKFSFRSVTILGGVLSCLSFVCSIFSPNIYVFILTFGFLAGCSCGLVFIPSIVIVNEYFQQKRGIANGIISSGSGAGLLVLGPIISMLLESYSLDGTILILAGILLNMCLFSSLYRQPMVKQGCVSEDWDAGQVMNGSQSSHLSVENMNQPFLLETVPDVSVESDTDMPVESDLPVPVNTVSHVPVNTVSHVPVNTVSHVPVNTVSHVPVNTVSHVPVNTVSHVPVNTVSHVPAETVLDVQVKSEESRSHDTNQANKLSDLSNSGVASKEQSISHAQEQEKLNQCDMLDLLKLTSLHRTELSHPGYRSPTSQNYQQQRQHHSKFIWNSDYHLDSKTAPQIVSHHAIHLSMHSIPTWCKHGCPASQHQQQNQSSQHQLPQHHHHRSSVQYSAISHGSNFYLAGNISTLVSLHNKCVTHAINGIITRTIHDKKNSNRNSINLQNGPIGHPGRTSFSLHNGSMEHPGRTSFSLHNGITEHPDRTSFSLHNGSIQHLDRASLKQNISSTELSPGQDEDLDKPASNFILSDCDPSLQPLVPHRQLSSCGHLDLTTPQADTDQSFGYSILQLLCMPSFLLFCLGSSLIQMAYPLAGAFLADFASHNNLNSFEVALLMGLLGGLNICGRLLGGILASLKLDPLQINNVSLLLGGVVCLLAPLYAQVWQFCLFASSFGFFLGFFSPLQPLIIVEYFGLGSMASAFGFLSTIKGVASILGVPLAGMIYDTSGQYSMSFIFGGCVLIVSSLIHWVMPCTRKFAAKARL